MGSAPVLLHRLTYPSEIPHLWTGADAARSPLPSPSHPHRPASLPGVQPHPPRSARAGPAARPGTLTTGS